MSEAHVRSTESHCPRPASPCSPSPGRRRQQEPARSSDRRRQSWRCGKNEKPPDRASSHPAHRRSSSAVTHSSRRQQSRSLYQISAPSQLICPLNCVRRDAAPQDEMEETAPLEKLQTCTALKERAPHAQAFVLPPSLPDQKGRRTLMYPTTETLRRVSESLEGVNRRARWGVASFVSHRSVESSEMRKKTIAYTDQKYFEYF